MASTDRPSPSSHEAANRAGSSGLESRGAWVAGIVAVAITPLIGLWLNMLDRHHQWSLIDEAHWAAEARFGDTVVDSVRHFFPMVFSGDLDAGRFRPLYDLVSFVEYQAPPWALLLFRGLQLLFVSGVMALVAVRHMGKGVDPLVRAGFFAFGVVLIASIPGFWTSMTWSSFQELPGLFFFAVVLVVRRTPGGAVLGLLIAGLYKETFAFSAAAAALVLVIEARTVRRLVLLICSSALVLVDVMVSSRGSYTNQVTSLTSPPLEANLGFWIGQCLPVAFVVALVAGGLLAHSATNPTVRSWKGGETVGVLTLAALAGYLLPLMLYLHPNSQRYLPVVVPVAVLLLLSLGLLAGRVGGRGAVLVLLLGCLFATLFTARTAIPEAAHGKSASLSTNAVIDWVRARDAAAPAEQVLVQGGMEIALSYNKLMDVYAPWISNVTFISEGAESAGLTLTAVGQGPPEGSVLVADLGRGAALWRLP